MVHRLLLFAIVAASAAQAVVWAFLVPIFQSPDEPEHLDYALAIHANKGLLTAQAATFQPRPYHVHPYTKYLSARTETTRVAFRADQKMSADYGSRGYYRALDRDAPTDLTTDGVSQLASLYPFGYYATLAGWIGVVRLFDERVVTMLFAARLFSVALLCVSLLASYGAMRLLRVKPALGLVVTACVGLFPMTSFVASYVQPDNLAFALTSLSLYLALRARESGFGIRDLTFAGLVLGGLLVTKPHFWLCVTPAVLAMVGSEMIARPDRRRWLSAGLCLLLPSIALGGLWLWTVWGTPNYFASSDRPRHGLAENIRLFRAAVENYFGGSSHESFWGVYGWLDTPIVIRGARMTAVVMLLIQSASWAVVGLTLLRMEQVLSRLIGVARRGRPKDALRIAFSDPMMNAYFLFVAFMLALFVWNNNRFGAQGRNWFPFMFPIFLVGLSYAPKALTLKPTRTAFTAVLAVGLLLYGTVGNYYARKSVRDRYYVPNAWHRGGPADG